MRTRQFTFWTTVFFSCVCVPPRLCIYCCHLLLSSLSPWPSSIDPWRRRRRRRRRKAYRYFSSVDPVDEDGGSGPFCSPGIYLRSTYTTTWQTRQEMEVYTPYILCVFYCWKKKMGHGRKKDQTTNCPFCWPSPFSSMVVGVMSPDRDYTLDNTCD